MVGRAGRPQFDTEATAVIMTRFCDKVMNEFQFICLGGEFQKRASYKYTV